jgi:flagellar biogenesis protein FliO
MIRRASLLALALALLAAFCMPSVSDAAKSERRRAKERPAKTEAAPEPKAEEAPPARAVADNAVRPGDNVVVPDNAIGPLGAIHESDIRPGVVVTGKPVPVAPTPSEGPSFLWAAVKMVFALGVVLAILLGISHYMKKYMDRFGAGAAAPGRVIAVTDARHLAPKTQVMVVEALGNRYLIGVTPTQVTLIDKVPGATSPAKAE